MMSLNKVTRAGATASIYDGCMWLDQVTYLWRVRVGFHGKQQHYVPIRTKTSDSSEIKAELHRVLNRFLVDHGAIAEQTDPPRHGLQPRKTERETSQELSGHDLTTTPSIDTLSTADEPKPPVALPVHTVDIKPTAVPVVEPTPRRLEDFWSMKKRG